MICTMLDALPKTCRNLELDTRGQDYATEDEQAHVCNALRRVLPRLRHARVRTGAMCCDMLDKRCCSGDVDGDDAGKARKSGNFEPINLPQLKSLLINCSLPQGLQIQNCGSKDFSPTAKQPSWSEALAAPEITRTLKILVQNNAINLKGAQVYMISSTQAIPLARVFSAEVRYDMVAKESWAYPIMPIGPPNDDSESYVVRLHDDSQVFMASLEDIEELAEGQIWRDAVGGTRLPAEVLEDERSGRPSFATGCVELPLVAQTMEQWIVEHSCQPSSNEWRNEQKTGMKLVLAEKRTGKAYLNRPTIRAITPEGWELANDVRFVHAK